MGHIEISDTNVLFRMLDRVNSSKPKSSFYGICPYCKKKIYQTKSRDVETLIGCEHAKQFLPK